MGKEDELDMFLTVTQAAKLLGCTGGRIRQLLIKKVLSGKKISPTLWLVTRKSVEKYKNIEHNVGRPRGSKNFQNAG